MRVCVFFLFISIMASKGKEQKRVHIAESKEDGDDEFVPIDDDADSVYPEIGQTIVLDSGTYNIRIGLSGEVSPSHIIPTVDDWASIESVDSQPVIRGVIKDFDHILSAWRKLITSSLSMEATDHAMILSEPFDITSSDRERLTEVLFESLHCPAFYVSPSTHFTLYATGRTSGGVVVMAYDFFSSTRTRSTRADRACRSAWPTPWKRRIACLSWTRSTYLCWSASRSSTAV